MKQVLKASGGLLIFAHIAIGILIVTIIGCGEAEDPLEPMEIKNDVTAESFGATKKAPDTAPAAPTMQVPEGMPTVKEVGYYSDWKLTEALSGTVAQGTTFFIKIVFSEPMRFTVADDTTARPILYHRLGKKRYRFKVAKHGASGEDFISGDAKPFGGGTDDFICKYTVPADATEKFRIEIGKFNADLDGNNLPAFYVHKEQLQCGQPAETKEPTPPPIAPTPPVEPETPVDPTEPADTVAPKVLSITHYRNGVAVPEGEAIPVSTIDTKVVFSEPVIPSITYTTGGETKAYTTSQQIGGVHWRGICKPTDASKTTWLCRQNALEPSFSVTVTTDTIDSAGNALVEAVTTPEILVTKPVVVQPQEPVQTLPDIPPITEPEEPIDAPGSIGDLGYTFTFPNGETYPGYNPSPGLQHILDTHPSAQLPHFEEAVQMAEVINWVYGKVWTVYPNSIDQRVAARDTVLGQFGSSQETGVILSRIYFRILEGRLPGHSQYWLHVEYSRLALEHPEAGKDQLFNLFDKSITKGWIVGIVNPND